MLTTVISANAMYFGGGIIGTISPTDYSLFFPVFIVVFVGMCFFWWAIHNRIENAGLNYWFILLAFIPVVNIGLFIYLCIAKTKEL